MPTDINGSFQIRYNALLFFKFISDVNSSFSFSIFSIMDFAFVFVLVISPIAVIICNASSKLFTSLIQTGIFFASVSICSFTFSSLLAIIKSGCRFSITDIRRFFVPPTIVFSFVNPMGCTQNFVMPTRFSFNPKSQSNSVCDGTNEMILSGKFSITIVLPS